MTAANKITSPAKPGETTKSRAGRSPTMVSGMPAGGACPTQSVWHYDKPGNTGNFDPRGVREPSHWLRGAELDAGRRRLDFADRV